MQQALTVAALLVQLAELSTLTWLHVPVLHFMVSVLVEHLSQDVRCRRSKHTCSRASTCFGARHMQRLILYAGPQLAQHHTLLQAMACTSLNLCPDTMIPSIHGRATQKCHWRKPPMPKALAKPQNKSETLAGQQTCSGPDSCYRTIQFLVCTCLCRDAQRHTLAPPAQWHWPLTLAHEGERAVRYMLQAYRAGHGPAELPLE